ncbi:MAG TPA: alpha/beta family hydrolase [Candidatus Acidoferrum sp.]|nr:alpha/beta family hydrolase [Candidatus Acidoferrum sp.]
MTQTQTHRSISIAGPAGRLEALLWNPARPDLSAGPPIAAVVCHPHPLFGGTMHNKVVYQIARTMDRLGIPSLRFNFRGVGLSEGKHDRGTGEQEDVRAALDFLADEFPRIPLAVAGFSFGCVVGLRVGCGDVRVSELIGLGAPVNNSDLTYLSACGKPKLLLQGENDQYGAPAKLKTLVKSFPEAMQRVTQVVVVPGADHFFAGHLEEVDAALTSWLISRYPGLAEK